MTTRQSDSTIAAVRSYCVRCAVVDIAQGVDEGKGLDLEQGAGDQGLMYGYACDETKQLMPVPIYYAHRLMERHSELRKDGRLPWLRPDAKSQVTVRYLDGKPTEVETVVISHSTIRT